MVVGLKKDNEYLTMNLKVNADSCIISIIHVFATRVCFRSRVIYYPPRRRVPCKIKYRTNGDPFTLAV